MIILKGILILVALIFELLSKCLYAISSLFMDLAIMLLRTASPDSKQEV